ncbi:MAG: TlpA family protein disulfide reductase [Bacteroidaceae bacterium]|nr:TlpA family protein disulfide reductase [Bacteroidaceae bacterium]
MKKMMMMFAALMIMAATSYAQDSVPAAKLTSKSETDAKLASFFQKLQAIPEDGNEQETLKKMSLEFVKENPNEAGSYVISNLLAHIIPTQELLNLVDSNEFFKNDEKIQEAKKNWLVQLETSEGKMFKDFEAEYEGKVTKLSDYVGKGKYVLVDFWASWCGPCKAEIPNLIKVYNQYKGEKFEVLGVATWDKPQDTKKAIEQMGIPYPQIMNAQYAGSNAYGITGIPQIILFGPDGTIVKRNLRGEAIEKTIAEVLK